MTTKYTILLVLAIFVGSSTARAQDDLLEQFKKGAETYNVKEAAKDNSANTENNEPSKSDATWQTMWDENKAAYEEIGSYFPTRELNCIFLMVLYVDAYLKLEDRIESTDHCQTKYDLYGLQASSLALSTTIMYCPEHIANLNSNEFGEVFQDLKALYHQENKPSAVDQWMSKLNKVVYRHHGKSWIDPMITDVLLQDILVKHFRPEYIVTEGIAIARKMEALGCADY